MWKIDIFVIKIKLICPTKVIINKVKDANWEHIFMMHIINKRLVSKIQIACLQFDNKMTNNKMKKWGRDLNRQFIEEQTWTNHKSIKTYLSTLEIRKLKLYNISPHQIVKIKNFDNTKYWGLLIATRTPTHCLRKYSLVQQLWRIIWPYLIKMSYSPTQQFYS